MHVCSWGHSRVVVVFVLLEWMVPQVRKGDGGRWASVVIAKTSNESS